jgi:hypothetical protein
LEQLFRAHGFSAVRSLSSLCFMLETGRKQAANREVSRTCHIVTSDLPQSYLSEGIGMV